MDDFSLLYSRFLVGLTEWSISIESQIFTADTTYSMWDVLSSSPLSEILRPLHLRAVSWGHPSYIWFLLKNSFPEVLSHIPHCHCGQTYMHPERPCFSLHTGRRKFPYRGSASLLRVRRLSKHFDFKDQTIKQSTGSQFPKISLPFLTGLLFSSPSHEPTLLGLYLKV